jgi:hypothetical protein
MSPWVCFKLCALPLPWLMEFQHFIYTASQLLLAAASVTHAHYLCAILQQLSDDLAGLQVFESIGAVRSV